MIILVQKTFFSGIVEQKTGRNAGAGKILYFLTGFLNRNLSSGYIIQN